MKRITTFQYSHFFRGYVWTINQHFSSTEVPSCPFSALNTHSVSFSFLSSVIYLHSYLIFALYCSYVLLYIFKTTPKNCRVLPYEPYNIAFKCTKRPYNDFQMHQATCIERLCHTIPILCSLISACTLVNISRHIRNNVTVAQMRAYHRDVLLLFHIRIGGQC